MRWSILYFLLREIQKFPRWGECSITFVLLNAANNEYYQISANCFKAWFWSCLTLYLLVFSWDNNSGLESLRWRRIKTLISFHQLRWVLAGQWFTSVSVTLRPHFLHLQIRVSFSLPNRFQVWNVRECSSQKVYGIQLQDQILCLLVLFLVK